MIQLYNVYKSYGGITPALVDVSMVIEQGAFVFVTGPSGAGKSTLLKILFRWERFDRGQVVVNGMNLSKMPLHKLYLLRREIGVVFQDYKLISNKTVFDNVAFALEAVEAERRTLRQRTWEVLKDLGLSQKKDAYPLQLSGGEQQRVAIARALANRPKILLADEPTGNLDPDIAEEVLKIFDKANRSGTTVLFATHSQEILKKSDHPIVALNRGKIIETWTA